MRLWILFTAVLASGAIVDRIAIVVGKHPVLDSSINRDIRVTSFLNNETADLSPDSRRRAANRLIDQELIREQIRGGGYPVATEDEADRMLAEMGKDRFPDDAAYRRALAQAGITADELKDRLLWQLTVLRFIDARFRPAAVFDEEEIQSYYNAHRAKLGPSLNEARQKIVDQLTGEHVNAMLDEWLKQARTETRIEYLEKTLQ